MKSIRVFLSEKVQFLEVKFSIYMYLNRSVFVMENTPYLELFNMQTEWNQTNSKYLHIHGQTAQKKKRLNETFVLL